MKLFLKQNALKHLVFIALAVIISVGFVPLQVSASSNTYNYRITALDQKKTITQKKDIKSYNASTDSYAYTHYLYKINVPANGYLRIASSNSSKNINIYKSINKNKHINSSEELVSLYGSRVYYRILPKGYYYIHADPGTKFNWSFNRKKAVYNYCMAKASPLKAGVKTGIFFTFGYEYDRWYKFSLTKNKAITLTFHRLDPEDSILNGFILYDSRGNRVKCPYDNGSNYRTGTLRKGTYYIRIWRSQNFQKYDYCDQRIVQIMWR